MKGRSITYTFCVLFFVLGTVNEAPARGVSLPVPAQANEIRNMEPEGAWLQTSYVVDAQYPDASVAQFYAKNIKAPWVACFANIPEWESFGDIANGNNRFVHQRLMYWVNKEEGKLLMVGMQYYSPGSAFRSEPVNTTQYVTVAEYPQRDVEQAIKVLGLECTG